MFMFLFLLLSFSFSSVSLFPIPFLSISLLKFFSLVVNHNNFFHFSSSVSFSYSNCLFTSFSFLLYSCLLFHLSPFHILHFCFSNPHSQLILVSFYFCLTLSTLLWNSLRPFNHCLHGETQLSEIHLGKRV